MSHVLTHTPQVNNFSGSLAHREKAHSYLAKAVSSTPRAAQLPVPITIEKAEGAIVSDVDRNRYIDYTMGYGPLILGHAPQAIIEAVKTELDKGLRTATVHRGEARLAELIANTVPCAEISSFLSSGTEAVQLALRIARAVTGRIRIVKFRANYHGWVDNVHLANGIGADGPSSAGQDSHATDSVELVDWGDADTLERVLTGDFAAVLMEVAAINAGCFAPPPGFLKKVRELTRKLGVILIFDEVISGYRLSLGGAQKVFDVIPDIAVLGKALGAGLPISAVTGTAAVMEPLVSGSVLHRGTYNGNPVSVAAGIACLDLLQREQNEIYPRIDAYARELQEHFNGEAEALGLNVCANRVGSAVQMFVGSKKIDRITDLPKTDKTAVLKLTEACVRNGLNPLPRGLMYLSAAHTRPEIEDTKAALSRALQSYKRTSTVS